MSKPAARKTVTTAIALGALAVAGCGGGSGGSGGSATAPARVAPSQTPASGSVGIGDALVNTKDQRATKPDTSFLGKLPAPSGVGAQQAVCAAASVAPSGANLRQISRSILCLLNAERSARGLSSLKPNKKLARAAIRHSRNMVARHYFSHNGPDGNPLSRIKRARYIPRFGFWTVGENLAFGTGTAASPAEIVKAWMNSPEHKANILTAAFKQIGIGIVPKAPTGSDAGATFTTTFGGIRKH